MARRCTVCDHPQCEDINKALINSGPYRTITDRYGVSKTALIRHKQSHIPELLSKTQDIQDQRVAALVEIVQEKAAQEAGQADSLLGQLKEWITRTERLFIKAEESGDLRTALAAVKEGRGNLELLGKLLGEIQDGVTVNINTNPVWLDLRAVILMALEPYPEAREALVNALARTGR